MQLLCIMYVLRESVTSVIMVAQLSHFVHIMYWRTCSNLPVPGHGLLIAIDLCFCFVLCMNCVCNYCGWIGEILSNFRPCSFRSFSAFRVNFVSISYAFRMKWNLTKFWIFCCHASTALRPCFALTFATTSSHVLPSGMTL